MVKVYYNGPTCKINAWLGGELFIGGIKEFADNEKGLDFAKKFHRKYEIIEEEVKPKTKVKKSKKVISNDK